MQFLSSALFRSLSFSLWMCLLAIPASAARSCESLSSVQVQNMTVTMAQRVEAGKFQPPALGQAGSFSSLPSFCRVEATLRPTSDSEIKIEVWLPEAAMWNEKYEAVGNGGWAGWFYFGDMANGLARGYATSSTDTGHTGGRATFAMGHPEKLKDYGYRAVHEMSLASKAIIAAYYETKPKLSYFYGCSSGGRQGLMEAQRSPTDFDGIVVGAPTNNWTPMMFERIWVGQATLSEPASYIKPTQYPMIHKAVLDACDMLDGVKDGVLEDPRKCHFDPGVLECKDSADTDCLTKPQVEAARKIYTPAKNAITGQDIFPPMERGSELVWDRLAGGPGPIALADDYFKYVVFEDSNWDFKTLNYGSDFQKAMARDGGTLSATNPDLRLFFSHGGKLIHYQGWTDQQVMPENSIHYFESVRKTVGEAQADASYRLFMVPGMNHCGGGDGPNKFDMLTALEQWKEQGKAPATVLASHATDGKIDRTRPLCAYPQISQYKGNGSPDDAVNFACVSPK